MADAPLVTRILALRESTDARSALRRGLSRTTEHFAYPYLAPWWQGQNWARRPTLVLGGLMGSFDGVRQNADVALGRLAAQLTAPGLGMSREGIERKLIASQQGDLERLVPTLRTLLRAAAQAGLSVDWNDVWTVVSRWDHPHPASRSRTRRALLERFYQTDDHTTPDTKETHPS